ncbi:O-acyltransferase like protein-like isoform X1 [Engystomops pustulosus]|uniref:O-acyltransferase like protein-like isoform X1 n=2 Tax=Engystomops pustulosus TaxID=76066 RepID=UPI003AFAE80B
MWTVRILTLVFAFGVIIVAPANLSEKCLQDTMDYLSDLNSKEPKTYAVLMYDSLGKQGSGIISGNVDRLGSYSECLSVQAPEKKFEGEYCKMHVEQEGVKFVIGICVPDSCSSGDITVMASMDLLRYKGESFLEPLPSFISLNESTPVVEETFCSRGLFPMDTFAIICLCLSGLFIMFPVIGSIHTVVLNFLASSSFEDCKTIILHRKARTPESQKPAEKSNLPLEEEYGSEKKYTCTEKVLKSFAIQENFPAVMAGTSKNQEYPTLNGIRILSLLWIISGHTSQLPSVLNIDNSLEWISNVLEKPQYIYVLSGPVFLGVDTFFFLSGFLGAKSFLTLTEKSGQEVTLVMVLRYIYRRFMRIQPLHLTSLCIFIGLISLVKWGAFWEIPKFHLDSCRVGWWANILLINNFVSLQYSCIGWTWYLSADFQFHLTVPLVIFLYVRAKRVMIAVVTLICAASVITTTLISYFFKLTIHHPKGESQCQKDYWVEYYMKPYCRYGPFLVGMILAILFVGKQSLYFKNRTQAALGWISALALMLTVISLAFVLDDTQSSYSVMAALYQGLHRTLWAVVLGLIFILCHEGYGGVVTTLLSFNVWGFLSKISYAGYLIHPMIIYFYCGLQEELFHYQDLNMLYLFIGHCALTFIIALLSTVLVEIPLHRLMQI